MQWKIIIYFCRELLKMKDTTTLKKIAETLGISISTVSRALKNHPDISVKTRQKVNDLATALDYEPNAYAIQLRTNKSNIFGLIVPSVSLFFYDSFISSVEEECRKSGYSLLILQTSDNPDTELENLRLCRQNRVSGVFACISPQTKNIEPFLKLPRQDVPVIFFDKVPYDLETNRVSLADAQAAKLAADVLLNKRKKNILAIFGNHELSITKRRLHAFSDTIRQKSSGVKVNYQHANNATEAFEITKAYLTQKKKPDAVFCMSDEILTGAMKAMQKSGTLIPSETGVLSMSNGFIPTLYHPEVSYIETSGYKLGKLAFTQMMACVSGTKINQELTVECVYMPGDSL